MAKSEEKKKEKSGKDPPNKRGGGIADSCLRFVLQARTAIRRAALCAYICNMTPGGGETAGGALGSLSAHLVGC